MGLELIKLCPVFLEKYHQLIHREMLKKMVKVIVEYLNIKISGIVEYQE